MKFILASASPRRKEILSEFGYNFDVVNSKFSEKGNYDSPVDTVVENAKGKALCVFNALSEKIKRRSAVIGADTVVCFNGKILGKPQSSEEAKAVLSGLSGKEHFVYTGYAIITEERSFIGYDKSKVVFNLLSDDLIEEYVATGSPLDKAGSYGIQDGFDLVNRVEGSIYNVIGFPIEKVKPFLDELKSK